MEIQQEFDFKQHEEAKLGWIDIGLCQPHPLNPRLAFNEEQVQRITEQIKQYGYKPEHAITVRPVNGYYQIVSGHHRVEACKRSAKDKILAWVHKDMSDERAHSLLLLDNDQSELTPLEKGKHAFDHIKMFDYKGGRGNTGGVSEYCDIHNLKRTSVIEWYSAYEVIKKVSHGDTFRSLSHRILYEISKSPESAWQSLCQHALDEEWTVEQTKEFVSRIKTIEKAIPQWWNIDFKSVVELAISNKTKANSFVTMFTAATEIADSLKTVTIYQYEKCLVRSDTNSESYCRNGQKEGEKVIRDGREYYVLNPVAVEYDQRGQFMAEVKELVSFPTTEEIRKIRSDILKYVKGYSDNSIRYMPVFTDKEWEEIKKQEGELAAIRERERYTPKLICDDVLSGLRTISNDSINLICTDPPYNIGENEWDKFKSVEDYINWVREWLQECYRILKDSGSIYVFGWNRMLGRLQIVMDEIGFVYQNWIIWDTIQGSGGGLWVNRYEGILYYSKTVEPYEDIDAVKLERHEENIREYKGKEYQFKDPSNIWRFPCVDANHPDRTDHPTQKPVELIERIIKASCPIDGVVIDCFIGSGTTGVAAMENRRLSIGIDSNNDYLAIARNRFEKAECDEISL